MKNAYKFRIYPVRRQEAMLDAWTKARLFPKTWAIGCTSALVAVSRSVCCSQICVDLNSSIEIRTLGLRGLFNTEELT